MKKNAQTTNVFIKECIALALVSLLQTKELDAISITELTRLAGVSRMAYYRNFSSKEDILYSYFEILLQQYDKAEKAEFSQGVYYDINHLNHYFSFILKHKTFLRTIITHSYGYIFFDTMTEYIINKWLTDETDQYQRYQLYAFSGALYSLHIGWTKHDFLETPEEMGYLLSSLLPHSIG